MGANSPHQPGCFSGCQLSHPLHGHENMQGLQQHVLHSWSLTIMSSKGIFTPTLYFSLWSWGQHGRGLLETQACSWWAWGPRVLPISMRWGISASWLFHLPPEDLPPNQWTVKTTSGLASRFCLNLLLSPRFTSAFCSGGKCDFRNLNSLTATWI